MIEKKNCTFDNIRHHLSHPTPPRASSSIALLARLSPITHLEGLGRDRPARQTQGREQSTRHRRDGDDRRRWQEAQAREAADEGPGSTPHFKGPRYY